MAVRWFMLLAGGSVVNALYGLVLPRCTLATLSQDANCHPQQLVQLQLQMPGAVLASSCACAG